MAPSLNHVLARLIFYFSWIFFFFLLFFSNDSFWVSGIQSVSKMECFLQVDWIGLPYLFQMISRRKQRVGILCLSLLPISTCQEFWSPHMVTLGWPILLKCMDVTIKALRSGSSASMLLSFIVMNVPFHLGDWEHPETWKRWQGATSSFCFLENAYFFVSGRGELPWKPFCE